MIILNQREHAWYPGMTVRRLLDDEGYVYKRIVVKINGRVIPESAWASQAIADGDTVAAIHLMAGG